MTENDRTHEPVVAAALDILGVQALLDEDATALSAANACDGFVGTILEARHAYIAPDPTSNSIQLFDRGMYFGDSMYLFGDPSEPEERQTSSLIAVCALTIWNGIYAVITDSRKKYAPRIGICNGNLRWRRIQTTRQQVEVPIGTSMARAHHLQESQDWVGGAVSAQVSIENHQFLANYAVPLKAGEKWWSDPVLALDWVSAARQDARYDISMLASDIRAHADLLTQTDAQTKWMNTLSFVKKMLE